MKKSIILLLILLVMPISVVYAVNDDGFCEMSDEYKQWLSLSSEEKKEFVQPLICKPITNSASKSKTSTVSTMSKAKSLSTINNKATISDTRYSSVDKGYVTPVRNQQDTGTCWAFSSMSVVETSMIKEGLGTHILSPRHLEYTSSRYPFIDGSTNVGGVNRNIDDGGNTMIAASYFYNMQGPVYEETMPFENSTALIQRSALPTTKADYLVGTMEVVSSSSGTCDDDLINTYKQKILNEGSISISMYYSSFYLTGGKYYYYYNPNNGTNHAVTIVGWDDTISASNFRNTPAKDGAFIVKNSYGTTYGDNGYFYLSYSDTTLCVQGTTFSDIEKNTYDYAYRAADQLDSVYSGSNYITFNATKFTKQSSDIEALSRVSFMHMGSVTYEVFVSPSSNLYSTSDWISVGSGSAEGIGVTTVKFDEIQLTNDFMVIVKGTNYGDETNHPVSMTCNSTDEDAFNYQLAISSGTNYLLKSTLGTINSRSSWQDLSTMVYSNLSVEGCANTIYAYTKKVESQESSFTVDSGHKNVSHVIPGSENYYKFELELTNMSTSDEIIVKLYNDNKTQMYYDFSKEETRGQDHSTIKIIPTVGLNAGTYIVNFSYGNISIDRQIIISDSSAILTSVWSNTYTVTTGSIEVNIVEKQLPTEIFKSNLDSTNSYIIKDGNGNEITSSTNYIGTGYTVVVGDDEFVVVYVGDINGDGMIKTNDSLLISRNIVGLSNLTGAYKTAMDVSKDNKLQSNDYLRISRFIIGLRDTL